MRKSARVHEEGRRLAKEGKLPTQIHDLLVDPEEEFESITDVKMARNMVEAEARKTRPYRSAKTIADQISICQKLHQDPKYKDYLQRVDWNADKRRPSFIMWNHRTMTDLTVLGRKRPLICGVDKTFRLSSC